jgi:hypothetical protein
MGVKLGFSHQGKNADCRCMRTGYLGEYLNIRGLKRQDTEENRITRSSTVCIPPNIVRIIKSMRRRLAGHVARMTKMRNV